MTIETDVAYLLSSPKTIQKMVAQRARRVRLDLNWSQQDLADRSGVSMGSLRRFESTGEISFKSLVAISIALNRSLELKALFAPPAAIDLFAKVPEPRQRAGRKS